jgi:hypothetical protein
MYLKTFDRRLQPKVRWGCYLLIVFGIFGAAYSVGNSLFEFRPKEHTDTNNLMYSR